MKFCIKLENLHVDTLEYPGFCLFSEVNDNGDLTIYKNHINMITPIAVANYASGTWYNAWAERDLEC